MNAITIRPLIRPQFDDSRLDCKGHWLIDNAVTLAKLWIEQSAAIGMKPDENAEDFDLWLSSQHDIEMALRGPVSKLPHGYTF